MFAANPLSDSQVFVVGVIAAAAVVYPLILLALGSLGWYQSKGEVAAKRLADSQAVPGPA